MLQNSLRGRCWGRDPQRVIDRAGQWNRWMRKRSIRSCGKHFPACGRALSDPHHDLPSSDATLAELLKEDVIPYTALMPELDAIMLAHVEFPNIDPEHPASMSKRMIRGFLRDQLGFDKHLVLTDDLDMGAITQRYGRGEDARRAIEAMNDLRAGRLKPFALHTARDPDASVVRRLRPTSRAALTSVDDAGLEHVDGDEEFSVAHAALGADEGTGSRCQQHAWRARQAALRNAIRVAGENRGAKGRIVRSNAEPAEVGGAIRPGQVTAAGFRVDADLTRELLDLLGDSVYVRRQGPPIVNRGQQIRGRRCRSS